MVLFYSYGGDYSDSPKMISEALHRIAPEIQQYWAVTGDLIPYLPAYVIGVEVGTKAELIARGKARAIIDNVYAHKACSLESDTILSRLLFMIKKFLKNKNSQYGFSTWHGTPVKRIQRDAKGMKYYKFFCKNTFMLLDNSFIGDLMHRLTDGCIDIKILGSPRNDLLYMNNEQKINQLKDKIGILGKKVVLYAPTFRSDGIDANGENVYRSGINQLEAINFDIILDTLSKRFGGEWVFIARFHYFVSDKVDWLALHRMYGNRVLNGNMLHDMTSYLQIADVLITDASSCMFDFAITRKPCFLFFPDYDSYLNQERGLYFDMYRMPFLLSKDFKELVDNIRNIDLKKYVDAINIMMKNMGVVENSKSSDDIAKFIVDTIKGER